MRYFPYTLHFILAITSIGLAWGCNQEHVRGIYQGLANGLAIGLCISAFIRLLATGGR